MRKLTHSVTFPARLLGLVLLTLWGVSACGEAVAPPPLAAPAIGIPGHENPLLAVWDTEFGVPPFDLITNEQYLPAFREAMQLHRAEIDAIVSNPEAPTFENTIVAFDEAGGLYSRVGRVFGAVNGANTNDTLQEVARTLAPERAAHGDAIILNPELWERVKAVFEQRDGAGPHP